MLYYVAERFFLHRQTHINRLIQLNSIVYSFSPPKQETFFKDDANHDPQWTEEEIISANFEFNGRKIGKFIPLHTL